MDYVKELEKQNEKQNKKSQSQKKASSSSGSAEYKEPKQTNNVKPPPKSGTLNVNNWSMLMHLSQFCSAIVPMAGFAVPIVLWQIKKDESDVIDQHGKNITNWIITEAIILGVGIFLIPVCYTGLIPLCILFVVGTVFPIVGAVKASSGEIWRYPLAIEFIK